MKPLFINFKPSRLLFIALLVMIGFMCMIVMLLPLQWQIKILLLLMLSASAYPLLRDVLLKLPGSCIAIRIDHQHRLEVLFKDGSSVTDVDISLDSVVTSYLTVIRYTQKNTPRWRRLFESRIIILPDSTDQQNFRKLRVWLRWSACR